MSKKREERITRLVDKWKPRLLLNQWAVIPTLTDEVNHTEGVRTLADTVVHPRYMDARLTVYPDFWEDPVGAQETAIIHELLHIPIHDLREALTQSVHKGIISERRKDDIIEQLTEYFAKVLRIAYTRNNKSKGGYLL